MQNKIILYKYNKPNNTTTMRAILIYILLTISIPVLAQKTIISGTVTDAKTGKHIAQASVTTGNVSVVTNDDGFFTLKTDVETKVTLVVSHLGYRSRRINVSAGNTDEQKIRLTPMPVELQEVVVWTGNPRELVNVATKKIPENYSGEAELFNCFYRETATKRGRYIYVAEGVVDMYKTSYRQGMWRDRVAIKKGRRLLSPKQSDTLGVKVVGGPMQPVQLDIAKNTDFLLNEQELDNYIFTMEEPAIIGDRMQYVVAISPGRELPYALYYGRLYIDRETLAFTRAELTLDMSNKGKATEYMLVHKPAGVRFRPSELTCIVDYRLEDGITRIAYIRNTFRFNCDWKRRLFATSFTASCEMVVTDRAEEAVRPPRGKSSFDARDSFYDKVDFFLDPHFWEDYNIIEPTESLDTAVDKLLKKYRK